jgi:hypothetical protein
MADENALLLQDPSGESARKAGVEAAANAKNPGKKAEKIAEAAGESAANEPKRIIPLDVARWRFGDFARTVHSVDVPAGTPFETVCRPEYWSNITRMVAGDIIDVVTEDQAWYARLFVMRKDRLTATIAVLQAPIALVPAYLPEPGSKLYDVRFAGSHGKWQVMRLSDKQTIMSGLSDEQAAHAWIATYERVTSK